MKTKILLFCLFLTINCELPCMTAHAESSDPICNAFFTPFHEKERELYRTFLKRCVASYGDYRSSEVVGHRHAGVDLKGKMAELVYAVGIGRVAYRYWIFPNETVAISHRLPDGETVYSIYTHIRDIQVKPGDPVHEGTVIGRLFNREEMRKAQFAHPHLHFEIRKKMDDFGKASFTSMSKKDLDEYCIDPKIFFKGHLK